MNLALLHRYCCKDSCVTHEINSKLDKWLQGGSLEHYRFNIALLSVLLYMELRGIRYDTALAKKRLREVNEHIWRLQDQLDQLTGFGLSPVLSHEALIAKLRETLCYKRDPTHPKAGCVEDYDVNMRILLGPAPLTPSERGRLAIALDVSLNTKGATFKKYLYETLKLPTQVDPKSHAPTTDYLALLVLTKKATTDQQRRVLDLAISIGELRTRSQMLSIRADNDGRIRAGYNVVGTKTARIACYTSPTGSGYNLQTIPEENTLRQESDPLRHGVRDLFIADEGRYLFKCDLSGADGWTIGAHLASLGERTMLDDLLAGIKPAAVVCYLLRHGNSSLRGKPRDEIKALLKEVRKEDWDYFACKQGTWGICYLMGPDKLAEVILDKSEGKVQLSRTQVKAFRDAVYARYHPEVWHRAVQNKLSRQPYPPKLSSAAGHSRTFFERHSEILGEALANEPQVNTTYAIKKALYRLWHDPENRVPLVSCSSDQVPTPPRPTAVSSVQELDGRGASEHRLDRDMRE